MREKLGNLLHHIMRKVYPVWANIHKEEENKIRRDIVASLKKTGEQVNISLPCLISGHQYISIGNRFHSGNHFRLQAFKHGDMEPEIVIGDDVSCEDNCHIGAINRIEIGDGTMIASNVFITDHFHGKITHDALILMPAKRNLYSKGSVKIGKNVWIGNGVCILPGVEIGDNVIIGANAVVTDSFGANVVVGGVPAKVIKSLE